MRSTFRNMFLGIAGTLMKPKPGVHIINSHYVTPQIVDEKRDTRIFENYLAYLSSFARFITLQEATKRIKENDIPAKEILIAFTFDDGFQECYTVIATLLEKYKIRGAFFINANYIDSDDLYQQSFNERVAITSKTPMSWKQVRDLHERGHLIGSHNLDHTNFALLKEPEIHFQLSENKRILEEKLDYQCDYFAWTYGQLQHFPVTALEIAKEYHPHIFSATNYKAYFSYKKEVLNRRHQEAFWPNSHTRYFLAAKKQ